MQLTSITLSTLARHLTVERKRQGLSRAQAAAVCNVSTSFIRDAESDPARCSLGRLVQYMAGLGLHIEVTGWSQSAQAVILKDVPAKVGTTPVDKPDAAEGSA